ncbi:Clavaminate synthase-like protein [Pleomassaria siparia CBS 279.74]|uniref:Clavaminate synthase-like protein n=1 Tax=Pleomassaria siparia CBS 279.74 TaxID=1314801 RepID=A0A6G1JXD9_9PLEO|nr:Clavaminate synthase-like protein [Pleomassaria siparia CBS 279.74]
MTIASFVVEEETTPAPTLRIKAELPRASGTNGHVEPIKHAPDSKVDFGAQVHGIDLNNFTDADFRLISDALHKHKLLIFKNQPEMLTPQQQYLLTSSFDPDETTGGFAHGKDPFLISYNGTDIYGIPKRPAIPVQPQVHILGRGPLPDNHYGFPPGFEVQGINHEEFHLPPHIPGEERETGASRFYQWHFDAALYNIPPPRVGCLLAVRTPKGPNVTVRWDDGTGTEMSIAPGATAVVAGSTALSLLDEETRNLVMHSRIEYPPHAFVWMASAHSARLGHLTETEGLEKPLDQLPKWDQSKVCVYPMVWTNPKTGEKSLQVHGQGAYKLYLKENPDSKERVVDDLKETEFPESYGPRVMHQCNIAASDHPTH